VFDIEDYEKAALLPSFSQRNTAGPEPEQAKAWLMDLS